jgi:glycosyltransferase involved in cell wall biosynthesis
MVLAVGRFVGGGRSKRQRELVAAFRDLAPAAAGWSLHLAGFVEDPAYVEAVRAEAEGLPVHLHLDLDRAALETLYGEASILWHACGLGVDQEQEPERVEHFGVVTAEAMRAGGVPVVVDRGGQPEIVGRDGTAGVLWEDVDDLVGATRDLIADDQRRQVMAEAALDRAGRFDMASFTARARELVLGEPVPPLR